MGPSISKSRTSFELVNNVTTEVMTKVLTEFSETVSSSNYIKVECSPDVYNECIKSNKEYKIEMAKNGIKLAEGEDLGCCSVSNVNQEIIVNIKTESITDNSVATKLQSALLSRIQEDIKASASGSLTLNMTDTERDTRIQNYITNKFNTDIVNKTLLTFEFKNALEVKNGSARGVTQKNVATIVSSVLAKAALDSDAQLKSDVDAILKTEDKTSGGLDNLTSMVSSFTDMVKGIMTGPMTIVLGLIALIFIAAMLKGGGKNPMAMMMGQSQMNPMMGQQQMDPMYNQMMMGQQQMNPMMGQPQMNPMYNQMAMMGGPSMY